MVDGSGIRTFLLGVALVSDVSIPPPHCHDAAIDTNIVPGDIGSVLARQEQACVCDVNRLADATPWVVFAETVNALLSYQSRPMVSLARDGVPLS